MELLSIRKNIETTQTSQSGWFNTGGNPYNDSELTNIRLEDVKVTQYEQTKVTSIPSPFARMHLVDIAFKVCSERGPQTIGLVSQEYKRMVSECLDLFEIFFRYDELDIASRGITCKKQNLASIGDSTIFGDSLNKYRQHYNQYIKTLLEEESKKSGEQYIDSVTFEDIYLIYNRYNLAFASTSPFTGFYTTSDVAIDYELEIDKQVYFSPKAAKQRHLSERPEDFQKFIYLLLYKRTQLRTQFKNLYNYVVSQIPDEKLGRWSEERLEQYEQFDFQFENPVINSKLVPDAEKEYTEEEKAELPNLVPGKYSSYFFKYILLPRKTCNFELTPADYKPSVKDRQLFGVPCEWLSVDDFLSSRLILTSYPLNEEAFIVFPLVGGPGKSAFIPVTETYFQYYGTAGLAKRISIVYQEETGIYTVTLRLPANVASGEVKLVKQYRENTKASPNPDTIGDLVFLSLPECAMGIYPLLKRRNRDDGSCNDFYKIFLFHSNHEEYKCDLQFYRLEKNEVKLLIWSDHIKCESFKKEGLQKEIKIYSLEGRIYKGKGIAREDVNFDLIKLTVTKGNMGSDIFLVPRFRECGSTLKGTVAIDLGTTTSFMLFAERAAGVIEEFATFDKLAKSPRDAKVEMQMLHKRISDEEIKIYQNNNKGNTIPDYLRYDFNVLRDELCYPHLLCMFMPSLIGDEVVHFPIQTALNLREISDQMLVKDGQTSQPNNASIPIKLHSLSHVNIPFDYYRQGERSLGSGQDMDRVVTDFKWESTDPKESKVRSMYRMFFIDQLMLMMRTRLMDLSYNLYDTHLIWTYPLSMDDDQLDEYKTIWERAYQKYLMNDINADLHMVAVSESLAPLYQNYTSGGASSGIKVSIDIGGGSSDVLVSENWQIVSAFSFRFAGNSLFGENPKEINIFGSINGGELKSENPKEVGEMKILTIPSKKGASVVEWMNYLLSTDPDKIEMGFKYYEEWKLLLLIHNCAIIYHTAQVCKMTLKEKAPKEISFSGNGSKLLFIGKGVKRKGIIESMVNVIFSYIYEREVSIDKITLLSDPKSAAGKGAIKGYEVISLTPDSDLRKKIIALGDETSYSTCRKQVAGSIYIPTNEEFRFDSEEWENYVAAIRKNIEAFIDFIIGTFATNKEGMFSATYDKEKLKNWIAEERWVEQSLEALKTHILQKGSEAGVNFTHSLFFTPIEKILSELSRLMVENKGKKNFQELQVNQGEK